MKRISDPPPRTMIRPGQVDNVARAVLALTRELWVVTDRLAIIETLLERDGVLSTAQIEAFEPDETFRADLAARRSKLISAVEMALRAA